jgi:hypothetical protein
LSTPIAQSLILIYSLIKDPMLAQNTSLMVLSASLIGFMFVGAIMFGLWRQGLERKRKTIQTSLLKAQEEVDKPSQEHD